MQSFNFVVNAIASVNAFVLFSFLMFRKNNSLPNQAIAIIMLVPALYFANSMLMLNQQGWQFYPVFFIVQFLAILYTPSVSTYVYALLGKSLKKLLPIYIVAGLIGVIPIYLGVQFMGWTVSEQQLFFEKLIKGPYPISVTIYSIIFYSFQQIIFIYLLVVVLKAKHKALGYHSNLDKTKHHYLQNFMTLLVVFNFLIVVLYLVFDILFVEYTLLPLIIGTIYTYIVYYAFKSNTVYTKEGYKIHLKTATEIEHDSVDEDDSKEEQQTKEIISEIDKALHIDGLLRDPQLSINKLAGHINKSVKSVSRTINTEMQSNFYDLVNSKRVEESKKLLQSKKEYTIEGVAYEVGFNSRASFYRAFKKYAGTTPTDYTK